MHFCVSERKAFEKKKELKKKILSNSAFLSRVQLVENIPDGLDDIDNATRRIPLFQGWIDLLDAALYSVDIVSSNWALRNGKLGHNHSLSHRVSGITDPAIRGRNCSLKNANKCQYHDHRCIVISKA